MTDGASEPNRAEALRLAATGVAASTNFTERTQYLDGSPVSIIYTPIFFSGAAGAAGGANAASNATDDPSLPAPPPPVPGKTVVGIHGIQFLWQKLLIDRLPLTELAIHIKVSRLYSEAGPTGGAAAALARSATAPGWWAAAGFQKTGTYAWVARYGNLSRSYGDAPFPPRSAPFAREFTVTCGGLWLIEVAPMEEVVDASHTNIPRDNALIIGLVIAGWSVMFGVFQVLMLRAQRREERLSRSLEKSLRSMFAAAAAKERAERESADQKAQFTALVSHEVRTPLNAIAGAAQLLRQAPAFDPEQARALNQFHFLHSTWAQQQPHFRLFFFSGTRMPTLSAAPCPSVPVVSAG